MPRLVPLNLMLVSVSAAGLAQPQSQPSSPVLARAIGEAPSPSVVAFVATQAEPTIYDPRHRPDLAAKTLDETIGRQCGSVQPGYKDALRQLNAGVAIPNSGRLGSIAFRLRWPACLHVEVGRDRTYTVKSDETLTSIRQKFTGDGAFVVSDLNRFYAPSGVTVSEARNLRTGQELKIPVTTSSTLLIPKAGGEAQFAASLENLGAGNVAVDARPEAPGEIVGPVRFRNPSDRIGAIQGTFEPCNGGNGDPTYPYDAGEVANAYSWMRTGSTHSAGRVTLVVIDNGFFGVPWDAATQSPKRSGDRLGEAPQFPAKLFLSDSFGVNGFGPVLSGKSVYPLNYLNQKWPSGPYYLPADVNEESGHGTHVAGLALGGPQFIGHRQLFFGDQDRTWLGLVIANLANGRRELLPGMDRDLGDILERIEGSKIVNMSVAFNARPNTPIGDTIQAAIIKDLHSLFVVAAGNDGGSLEDDDHDLYPANLGGGDKNVLTVASVDAPLGGISRLSTFSNRSAKHVDIAAPGCKLLSWVDGDRNPVEVSGTSQATPLVSFAAALLNSLWDVPPDRLKNRLLYSGDVLDEPADRSVIRSRSRLNIAKALTFTTDRITFRKGEIERTLLGQLDALQGLTCEGGAKIDSANVRAVKRARDGSITFFRTRSAGPLDVCTGVLPASTAIGFVPLAEIKSGRIADPDPLPAPIEASEIVEIVLKK